MIMQEELRAREESSDGPIRVAVIGAGQMGEGLVCQMELMTGMHAVAICDVRQGRAEEVFASAGVPSGKIVNVDDPQKAARAIHDGKRVAATNADVLLSVPDIEIIVESTGVPEIGARVAYHAILERKHVLQMNVETDATVGYLLRQHANAAGVVYTLTAGDEPGSCMELYDFAVSLGFDVVCAGKGKNNPLDQHANPESVAATARVQQMNPKMLASFVDGTKTMVEMTSLGNAIGFTPDVPGMIGPECGPKELAKTFSTKQNGGVISAPGRVEYARGVAPGVFVVFTSDHPKIIRDLGYLKLGDGPCYALYRPYHLTSLETPISIARAVLFNQTTIATDIYPVCETVAQAKKPLKSGETIDSLGGFTVYGVIRTSQEARSESLLPLGLAPGARLTRDIGIDEPIRYEDVEIDPGSYIVQLRKMQDTITQGR